jgi:hypothetical protein
MHQVKIILKNADKEILINNGIELCYVKNLLETTFNIISPAKRKHSHSIRILFVDEDFSYYSFSNVLNITKCCFNETTKTRKWHNFFNDLMHEACHYMQFKINHVNITNFFVDHDNGSVSKYLNNSTERQARRHGGMAHEITSLYGKLLRVRHNDSKQLSKLDEKRKDQAS